MEYDEAVARLNELRIALGSGIKGEQYKAVLQEYLALKAALRNAQGSSGGGGGGGGGDWWENRGSGSWSML